MKEIFIYLSGSIPKAQRVHVASFWGKQEIFSICAALQPVKVHLLNPVLRSDDLSDNRSVFGRDMLQVFLSDLVIVDAREKRGVGVGAEMFFAKQQTIPVISIVPPDSHYSAKEMKKLGQTIYDWKHPFIDNLSDEIVSDLETALIYIKKQMGSFSVLREKKIACIKELDFVFSAMQLYLDTQLEGDAEMANIINHESLETKLIALRQLLQEA